MERSDGTERCGVSALGSAVVEMHAPPGLEVPDDTFDDPTHLIDSGVELELLLPVKKRPAGWLTKRGSDTASDVAFVADGGLGAEDVGEADLPDGLRVVGLAGQRVGDVHQLAGQVSDELVDMARGAVLAGVQLGRIRPRPARTQRAVDHPDPPVGFLGQVGDELVEDLSDDPFQGADRS